MAATGAAMMVAAPAHASEKGWADASDIGRSVLVAAALGAPLASGDDEGLLQAAGSVGVAGAVTYAMKETIHETRPDGSNRKSFPSGHTSISFASAATLQNRYGWQVGLPAQALAAFVGVARVQADKHYWHDVLVGAAIGEAAGFLITSRRDDGVVVMPWGDAHGGGVAMAGRF